MAVYVDDMYTIPLGEFRGMKMSHMIADTREELLAMVAKIGVSKYHIQHLGTANEHFDICKSKRDLAVKNGAVEISMRQCSKMIQSRKKINTLTK
jgi:hypothetical protein